MQILQWLKIWKKKTSKNHRQFIRTCFFISVKFYPPLLKNCVYAITICYTDIVLHCPLERLLCSMWLFTDFKSWTSVTRPMCSATREKRNSGRMPSGKVYLSRASTGRSVSPSNWLIICNVYTCIPRARFDLNCNVTINKDICLWLH